MSTALAVLFLVSLIVMFHYVAGRCVVAQYARDESISVENERTSGYLAAFVVVAAIFNAPFFLYGFVELLLAVIFHLLNQ